jgi:dipeptidyl aminopeptidase/acylaminoacyl peptidase
MTRSVAILSVIAAVAGLAGCRRLVSLALHEDAGPSAASAASRVEPAPKTLAEERKGFATKGETTQPKSDGPPPRPPAKLFSLVRYPSQVGQLTAYVTPAPADGARRPAIVWVVGGFSNGIGSFAWEPATRDNDQSARAFREAGIVLMLPSFRGGNDNPGRREGFYGEVDDVIAAGDYVSKLPYVDPARVYLGGHSTGGTMALLVAESTARFRAIFAFGPVADIRSYAQMLPLPYLDDNETRLRSPMNFTGAIQTPTFAIEGTAPPVTNAAALPPLLEHVGKAPLTTIAVPGANHFSLLAPATALIAKKILGDTGSKTNIALTEPELAAAVAGAR